MKKIAIDATLSTFSGAKTYIVGLVHYLVDSKANDVHFFVFLHSSLVPSFPSSLINEPPLHITFIQVKFYGINLFIWRLLALPLYLRRLKVGLVFYPSSFQLAMTTKYVALSQNILPFHPLRNSFALPFRRRWKTRISRAYLSMFFFNSSALIFLNSYAQKVITSSIPIFPPRKPLFTIPHGIEPSSDYIPKLTSPFKCIYVSTLDSYKNHHTIIEALQELRINHGLDIRLDLVGESTPWTLCNLNNYLNGKHPYEWIAYHGTMTREQLFELYRSSNIGIFGSSCENMSIALNELISFGIPTIHSDAEPMLSTYANPSYSFNPVDPQTLITAFKRLALSPENYYNECKRLKLLSRSMNSWYQTYSQTLDVLLRTY